MVRDGDLELLLGDAQDEATGSAEDFAQLVQSCVAHLGCSVGALVIPDRNIAVCRTGEGTPPRAGADVLTQTHRPLLAWIQQQRKSLVANEPSRPGVLSRVPYKVLCCPVMQGSQRVLGMLALYKPPGAPDFDLRQVRIVELLARRAAHILLNAYDPATGLLTRPAFEKRAQAAMRTEAQASENCVIYVDIDRLHVLNENLGLHVGDEVIVRVAEVIRRALAPRMLASRISGDRFAVLMGEAPLDRGREFAEMLCEQLGALDFIAGGKAVEVSASFGVARVGDGKQPLAHALAAAEIACKAAKDRGRNRVELYEDSDQSIVRRYTDVTLVGTLRHALAHDSFRLEAQAIVPLNGAAPGARYELLLRMTDEQQRTITPEKFLSAAERYQLAPAVDRWVVSYVLKLLTPLARPLADKGARFAVNISGQSLGDEELHRLPRYATARSTDTATDSRLRADRDRGRRQHRSRGGTDPPPAGSGLRGRAGRFRPGPELARLPQDAARHLAQDRQQPGARHRRGQPVAGHVERHRAARPGHRPQDRGGRRRNGGDPPDNRPTGRRIRPGVRYRPSRSAGRRDRKARRG